MEITMNGKKQPFARSSQVRGQAAMAREYGRANGVEGFGYGEKHRQKANEIIHAEPGQARNYAREAAKLENKALKSQLKK